MGNISTWKDNDDANGTSGSPPDYWPEGQAPSTVNNCARAMMGAIRRQWQDAGWFDYGLTVSLKSQNKIKITSSSYTATDIFLTNRRVKVVSNSVTIYGDVSTVSSSGSSELVTIICDSGTLTSTVSRVSVGIIEPTNSSIPGGGPSSIFIEQDGSQIFAADAGANDTYVIALDPAISAYVTGMVVSFSANTVNTGAATININGLGAKAILKNHNIVLENGDIEAGQVVNLVYDGTQFQMQSQLGNQVSPIAGMLVQVVTASTNTSVTTTTAIPFDDTVPQNTEGAECMTLAITPTSATNRLIITFNALLGAAGDLASVALFQDATAGALAATSQMCGTSTQGETVDLVHTMISGTASATTFKFRFGPGTGGTATRFLGSSAADKFGTVGLGTVVIYEIQV